MTSIVNGLKTVWGCVQPAAGYVGSSVSSGTNFLAKELLSSDGVKTFVAKPLHLAGVSLKYLDLQKNFPILHRLATDGSAMKALISGLEIITKPAKVLKELKSSDPITRNYACIVRKIDPNKPETEIVFKTLPLTSIEAVFSRLFQVASWLISVGDAMSLIRNYRPIHATLDKTIPWIYAVAGGYMGIQGLYTEGKFAYEKWKEQDIATAEIYSGCLGLVSNTAYLFSSAVGALGIYYSDKNPPAWLGKYQFAAQVGNVIFPIAQKCAKQWMINYGYAQPAA